MVCKESKSIDLDICRQDIVVRLTLKGSTESRAESVFRRFVELVAR